MRRINKFALTVFALLVPALGAAQQATTISGRVTGDGGTPLPAAQVFLDGLGLGSITDDQGRYSFTAPGDRMGQTVSLTARRIGYQPRSVQVTLTGGALSHDFSLTGATTILEGVVVTALGRTVEKSRLGTAQQQLNNEQLNQTRTQNVVQQIQGKVSGIQITGAGAQGGSTNIVIRGQNSLTSSNQPLFVVDGVPVSNASRGGDIVGRMGGGFDFGNAIADINSDDIETFTVLKGPNAAAIYGSRAANGVIEITTKKGRNTPGRMRTELSTSITFERPSHLPDFQNSYGQGVGGDFSYLDGAGGSGTDYADQSWGPKLDGRLIDQFHGKQQPWVPAPDNVKNFFETGQTLATTFAVSGGTDRANARLSIGADNTNGVFPNNSFQRRTGLLTGTLKASSAFTIDGSLNYIRNTGRNRPGSGYLNSTLESFFWYGRQVNTDLLRDYAKGGGVNNGPATREYNWNYNYHNNPFWLAFENPILDSRDRFIGSVSGRYRVADWLNATLRTGSDIYRLNIDQKFARGNLTNANPSFSGAFLFINDYRNDNNTDLVLSADRQLNSWLQVSGIAGGASRRELFRSNSEQTRGISVPGIYNPSNAAIAPTLGQSIIRRQVNSAFGSAAVTMNRWLTVEATGRNDWSSTLPEGANSYFYPSISASLVLTEALPALRNNRFLTYGKLRGGFARVGNDAPPYQLQSVFVGNPNQFSGQPQFSLENALANLQLKPEITKANEAGVELSLLGGRVTLDGSVYKKSTTNQIFPVTVSPTSGFTSKFVNAGEISNTGTEVLLSITPIQASNFSWTSTFNYGKNKSKVVDLAEGITTIVLGRTIFGEASIEARKGLPYGSIYGTHFARDDQGRLLTSDGLPFAADTLAVLGNIQPNWTGGWNNQFTFRNFSLNMLFDIKSGGDIFSHTNSVGEYSGVLESSLRGREVDFDTPGIVVDGIDVDTGLPNTVNVTSETYFQGTFPTAEPYVYDGGYVKLRELRLGMEVPGRFARRFGAQSMSIALTGRNLKTWTDVPNIDPEFALSSSNNQGIEYAIPSNPRSIGFSLRIIP